MQGSKEMKLCWYLAQERENLNILASGLLISSFKNTETRFLCYKTYPFKEYNSVSFSIFTRLYSPNSIWYPLHPIWTPGLTNTGLLTFSMDLHILNISYKWNYTIHGLLCLASLLITTFPRFIQL